MYGTNFCTKRIKIRYTTDNKTWHNFEGNLIAFARNHKINTQTMRSAHIRLLKNKRTYLKSVGMELRLCK